MRRRLASGFVLPVTIALSMGILIVSTTFAQYVINSSMALNTQSYKGIAQEAANSGIAFAVSCFATGSSDWPSLTPQTGCGGSGGASKYMTVAPDGSWRSTFTVNKPTYPSGNTKIVAKGSVEVLSGDTKVMTIDVYKGLTITSTYNSTLISTGEAISDISSDSHSCAIANGKLYCWGLNNAGQLGNGSTANANSPQLIAATNSGDAFYKKVITAMAVGTENSCAVADGQLYCWGDNSYGQLGNGSTGGIQTTPQLVSSLASRKVTSISASQSTPGPKSVCAVADGITYCWGSNSNQQLGQTVGATVNTTNRSTPTPVYGYRAGDTNTALLFGKKAQSASIGAHNACQVAIGKLYCWGNIASPTTASPVKDMSTQGNYAYGPMALPWSARVIGDNSCSITSYLVCHGNSGAYGNQSSPSIVGYSATITDYEGGDNVANPSDGVYCIATADLYCNGTSNTGNYSGTLTGSPDTNGRLVTKVGVGNQYGCLIANGGLACWGTENQGQLADGNFTGSSQYPKMVAQNVIGTDNTLTGTYPGFDAWGPIAAGTNHECSIANGSIFCWGSNSQGQLGVGNMNDQSQPTVIDTSNFPSIWGIPLNVSKEKVAAGGNHSCVVAGGALYCWGSNSYGELGTNNTTMTNKPLNISGLPTRVTDVSAGTKNTCAIANSQLYCWGDDSTGQIGDGSAGGLQLTPKLVSAFAGKQVSAVAVGTNHICAIVNGDGYCWGSNANYATGLNTTNATFTLPAAGKITGGLASPMNGNVTAAFTAISAGDDYTCAIINGVVGCWGRSDRGQSGTGYLSSVTVPTLVGGSAGSMQATTISAGQTHACATLQGAIYCWGNQDNGRLGNGVTGGSQPPQTTPLLIDGGATVGRTSVNVAAGDTTSCSASNGVILCWGAGTRGQIGDGALTSVSTPTAVTGYRTTGTYTRGQIY